MDYLPFVAGIGDRGRTQSQFSIRHSPCSVVCAACIVLKGDHLSNHHKKTLQLLLGFVL
jgi:hypothetical protein